ncbi:hypothetical protein A2U01_0054310, partial [Trifolium medium]|nr:hypothetical protein [Trifolium medium]
MVSEQKFRSREEEAAQLFEGSAIAILKFKSSPSSPSTNIVGDGDDDDILLCEDEVDSKAKKCETLDEGRICWAKVGIHPRSPTS